MDSIRPPSTFAIGTDGNNSWTFDGTAPSSDYVIVDGRAGNDVVYVTSTGSSRLGMFTAGDNDDRLVISAQAHIKTTFDGGNGVDTLELSGLSNAIVMSANAQTGTIGVVSGQIDLDCTDVERFVISGTSSTDKLVGGAGNDWLNGAGGVDAFQGSTGDDGYVFDSSDEFVAGEDAGFDTIWTTASQDLNRSAGVEHLRLEVGDIDGTGNALANTITGSAGNNVIAGGLGKDQLWGKGGNDTFAFAEMGAANKDTIFDFNDGDRVQLSKAVFAGLDANGDGALDAISLNGKAAGGTFAQLIYNGKTGVLSYDADGTGAGVAQDIAVIGKNLNAFLGTDDFLLVA